MGSRHDGSQLAALRQAHLNTCLRGSCVGALSLRLCLLLFLLFFLGLDELDRLVHVHNENENGYHSHGTNEHAIRDPGVVGVVLVPWGVAAVVLIVVVAHSVLHCTARGIAMQIVALAANTSHTRNGRVSNVCEVRKRRETYAQSLNFNLHSDALSKPNN